MYLQYIEKKFNGKTMAIIEHANKIIASYEEKGLKLTLRQLYYKFVAQGLLPNTLRSYKNLGNTISDARLTGLISWEAIEDRTRNLRGIAHCNSPAHAIRKSAEQYAVDKWGNQPHRVEVWVEKDALVGVIQQACSPLDVNFFSCRGYTSQSEMWGASERLKYYRSVGQEPVIIHLGDFDPSGVDMSRDINDRQSLFMGGVEVKRIALNMDQIEEYDPPPNPAKVTDSRAKEYIKKYGTKSWELDALEPEVVIDLIEKTILKFRDDDKWNESVLREKEETAIVTRIAERTEDGNKPNPAWRK